MNIQKVQGTLQLFLLPSPSLSSKAKMGNVKKKMKPYMLRLGLAALAPGRLNEMPGVLSVFSNGLNKYGHEWIKHMFPFLERINISVIGLNKYFGDWI